MKQKIFNLVEKGARGSKINLIFDYFIVSLIVLNIVAIGIETITDLNTALCKFLSAFEIFSIIIFSIEYLMRLYVSDLTHPAKNRFNSATRFIFSLYGLIDLFAILPFYLPFLIKIDLRFLRILRLIRLFRVFKISRYNNTLKLLWDVAREKKAELKMTLFIASLLILVSAFLIYYAENPVQPEIFSDIFSSLWWSISTLTTVGYGDIVPITSVGKIISSFVAILGIGIIALPTGLISAGFIEKINKTRSDRKKITCPHCGKEF